MKNESDIQILEQQLGQVLHPVAPKSDFISDLQERLKKKAIVVVENPDYLVMILFIVSGLFVGVVLIWVLKIIFGFLRNDD